MFFDKNSCAIGHKRCKQNQNSIFSIPAHVKIVAGYQYNSPAASVRQEPVYDKDNW